jgi:cytochrome c oxidase cbb3-type subunit III
MLASWNVLLPAGVLAAALAAFAQAQQPASTPTPAAAPAAPQISSVNAAAPIDPAAVARGQQTFTQNCSFCHGPDARGGAEGGVDLTRSPIVIGDATGAQLGIFLKTGRPPRMPAFTSLTDAQITDINAFVQSQNIAVAGRAPLVAIVVGDPKAGEAFFNGAGKCSTCHSVTGDLKGIGSKYDVITLQGHIVLPRGSGGWPSLKTPFEVNNPPNVPRKVTVTEANGKVTTGDLVSISDFDVVLRDDTGLRHTFARNGDVPKVEIKDPLQAHVDMMPHLTDEEMHDLTAYLVTQK